ncbi:MAG: glycosyltransferase [Cyanobacteriota bacterium]|nr:glycosyltransferase [Cyanobacteriota bacterium]
MNSEIAPQTNPKSIEIEGWRFVPHSFAIVNQFQLLEMRQRQELRLFHREMPYFDRHWKPQRGLLDANAERTLSQIPHPPPDCPVDAVLRVFMPYNLKPAKTGRTCVLATTEWGIVQKLMLNLMGVPAFWDAHRDTDTIIITPSEWSRRGFLRSGADPARVVVVPHGVDTRTFYPLSPTERTALRQKYGIDGCFAFLHISVMTWNKGIRGLLKAFAAVVERYPQARLILKGMEALRKSREFIVDDLKTVLTEAEAARVIPRIAYLGDNLSAVELAQLHQIADAYVAPYLAEGFNMPVLEAAACGLPIICTRGGPTDDFTRSDFALHIESKLEITEIDGERRFYLHPHLEHTIALMCQAIEQPGFLDRARQASVRFVENGYTWRHVVDRLLGVMLN